MAVARRLKQAFFALRTGKNGDGTSLYADFRSLCTDVPPVSEKKSPSDRRTRLYTDLYFRFMNIKTFCYIYFTYDIYLRLRPKPTNYDI